MSPRFARTLALATLVVGFSAEAASTKLQFRCSVLDAARRLRGLDEKILANATVILLKEEGTTRLVIDSPVLSADLKTAAAPRWDVMSGRADGYDAVSYFGREAAVLGELEGDLGIGTERDPASAGVARVLPPFTSAHKNLKSGVVVRYVLKSEPKEPRDAILDRCEFDGTQVQQTLGFKFVDMPSGAKGAKVVGFDIDDTLLWSEPAFRLAREAKAEPFSTPFWRILNESDRLVSRVKRKALELVRWHQRQGARVIAVTKRQEAGRGDVVRAFIAQTFGIAKDSVFFEPNGKTDRLKAEKAELFYGDSDGDIEDAKAAGIPGVRFLRSPHTTYRGDYNAGKFGEEILVGSYDEL